MTAGCDGLVLTGAEREALIRRTAAGHTFGMSPERWVMSGAVLALDDLCDPDQRDPGELHVMARALRAAAVMAEILAEFRAVSA